MSNLTNVWECQLGKYFCKTQNDIAYSEIISENTKLIIVTYFSASKLHQIISIVSEAKLKIGNFLFGTIDSRLFWKLTYGKFHAVDMHVNAGVTVEKINLAISFYRRIWKGVKAESDQVLFNNLETVGMGIDYVDF